MAKISFSLAKNKLSYICPMHPEVKSSKPGRCPKCGMDLVPQDQQTNSSMEMKDKGLDQLTLKNYVPLIVIIGLILLTAISITLRNFNSPFLLRETITFFMAGFFITFSGFKLIDMKGFAQGYFTYDLLAKKVFAYGYIYPFIELFFGISMILFGQSIQILLAEAAVMTFSGLGVAIKLVKREKFQCVCLGTFLKVPLTYVTLIEDFGMAALALLLIILK